MAKIYIVNHEYLADKKIYFVNHEYLAQENVYIVNHEYLADWKAYVVQHEYLADVKVYIVQHEYLAGRAGTGLYSGSGGFGGGYSPSKPTERTFLSLWFYRLITLLGTYLLLVIFSVEDNQYFNTGIGLSCDISQLGQFHYNARYWYLIMGTISAAVFFFGLYGWGNVRYSKPKINQYNKEKGEFHYKRAVELESHKKPSKKILQNLFKEYRNGSDAHQVDCVFGLANCYRDGKGTEKNIWVARRLYREAIILGHPQAKDELDKIAGFGEWFRKYIFNMNFEKNKNNALINIILKGSFGGIAAVIAFWPGIIVSWFLAVIIVWGSGMENSAIPYFGWGGVLLMFLFGAFVTLTDKE